MSKNLNLKYFNLVFENCEECKVSVDDIQCFNLDDITENRQLHWNTDKRVFDYLHCLSALVVFKPSAANTPTTLTEPLFNRLEQCPDITAIELIYEDDSKELIYVPWLGDYERNHYMQLIKDNEGNMWVLITRDSTKLTALVNSY